MGLQLCPEEVWTAPGFSFDLENPVNHGLYTWSFGTAFQNPRGQMELGGKRNLMDETRLDVLASSLTRVPAEGR